MGIFQKSGVGTFTRGGQTTLHFIRMIAQVIGKFGLLVVVVFVAVFWLTILNKTTSYERYVTFKHGVAQVTLSRLKRPDVPVPFRLENGQAIEVQQNDYRDSWGDLLGDYATPLSTPTDVIIYHVAKSLRRYLSSRRTST